MRVGYAVEPPYAFLRPDGTVTGESPGVALAVATRLELRVEWVQTTFDRLIDELQEERFDIIAAGMFVTEARARRVRFTRPTVMVRPGWLTAAGNPRRLADYTDVAKQAGVRVVVIAGSVEEDSMRRAGLPAASLIHVPDAASGESVVRQGLADALALSLPSVRLMARKSLEQLEAVPAGRGNKGAANVALAVRSDAAELQRAIDGVLASYVGSDEHVGMISAFGFNRDDLPGAADERH